MNEDIERISDFLRSLRRGPVDKDRRRFLKASGLGALALGTGCLDNNEAHAGNFGVYPLFDGVVDSDDRNIREDLLNQFLNTFGRGGAFCELGFTVNIRYLTEDSERGWWDNYVFNRDKYNQ